MSDYLKLLSCWHKLEHFAPSELPKSDHLRVLGDLLPWEKNLPVLPKDKVRVYTVYLGVFSSKEVMDFVRSFFGDVSFVPSMGTSKLCYASLKLNERGEYYPDTLGVSTLPFALAQLERNRIGDSDWAAEFDGIVSKLKEDMLYEPALAESVPSLEKLEDTIMTQLGWSVRPETQLYVRTEVISIPKGKDAPEVTADLLNSFYINDLERIIRGFDPAECPRVFMDYLKGCLDKEFPRCDLSEDTAVLADVLQPGAYPAGCWPSGYQASLMQQFAVNTVMKKLSGDEGEGIFSVNGPPGTGKTTLLRDIIAGILVKRARRMAAYSDPCKAFRKAGEMMTGNSYNCFFYAPDEELTHAGMVIASSNNGAVENISKELPLKKEVGDYSDIGYFRAVSESCVDPDNWGLVSAVLGNKENRNKLVNSIWFNQDKEPGKVILRDYLTGDLPDWDDVVERFHAKWQESEEEKRRLTGFRQDAVDLRTALTEKASVDADFESVSGEYSSLCAVLDGKKSALEEKDRERRRVSDELEAVRRNRPGFFTRLFNSKVRKAYNQLYESVFLRSTELLTGYYALAGEVEELNLRESSLKKRVEKALAACKRVEARVELLVSRTDAARKELGKSYANDRFWQCVESQDSQEVTPWYSERLKRIESDLFVCAMEVNEAFLLHANASPAKRVTNSLNAFFHYLKESPSVTHEEVKALWDTFFLVIPVVSTTFASIQRMFSALECGDIPWLFVDEAGQAVPQAAAGAIWRSKRVVVVGDPFQIEPVVTVPAAVTDNLSRYFDLTVSQLHSSLSVQSMADRTNPYGWYTNGTWIGSPLRVHRRCIDPMFSIANAIAYEGKMYNSTINKKPKVDFRTEFIDCGGQVEGRHYVPAQGEKVQEIICREIGVCKGLPDLFVITPFSEIAYKLRTGLLAALLQAYAPFAGRDDAKEAISGWLKTHIGTVHTFQGKQADGVILCLGLDSSGKGAAAWASSKPNLLNVALTRAKYRFIATGDSAIWFEQPYFRELKGLGVKE